MPSPALNLQHNLHQAFHPSAAAHVAEEKKIPVGWALLGVSIACAAVWGGIAALIF